MRHDMKLKDFIEKLQQYDGDATVFIHDYYWQDDDELNEENINQDVLGDGTKVLRLN